MIVLRFILIVILIGFLVIMYDGVVASYKNPAGKRFVTFMKTFLRCVFGSVCLYAIAALLVFDPIGVFPVCVLAISLFMSIIVIVVVVSHDKKNAEALDELEADTANKNSTYSNSDSI